MISMYAEENGKTYEVNLATLEKRLIHFKGVCVRRAEA
jgi:hypothetical protein